MEVARNCEGPRSIPLISKSSSNFLKKHCKHFVQRVNRYVTLKRFGFGIVVWQRAIDWVSCCSRAIVRYDKYLVSLGKRQISRRSESLIVAGSKTRNSTIWINKINIYWACEKTTLSIWEVSKAWKAWNSHVFIQSGPHILQHRLRSFYLLADFLRDRPYRQTFYWYHNGKLFLLSNNWKNSKNKAHFPSLIALVLSLQSADRQFSSKYTRLLWKFYEDEKK